MAHIDQAMIHLEGNLVDDVQDRRNGYKFYVASNPFARAKDAEGNEIPEEERNLLRGIYAIWVPKALGHLINGLEKGCRVQVHGHLSTFNRKVMVYDKSKNDKVNPIIDRGGKKTSATRPEYTIHPTNITRVERGRDIAKILFEGNILNEPTERHGYIYAYGASNPSGRRFSRDGEPVPEEQRNQKRVFFGIKKLHNEHDRFVEDVHKGDRVLLDGTLGMRTEPLTCENSRGEKISLKVTTEDGVVHALMKNTPIIYVDQYRKVVMVDPEETTTEEETEEISVTPEVLTLKNIQTEILEGLKEETA